MVGSVVATDARGGATREHSAGLSRSADAHEHESASAARRRAADCIVQGEISQKRIAEPPPAGAWPPILGVTSWPMADVVARG
eukprot:7038381-Prymnesium_polylepis.1